MRRGKRTTQDLQSLGWQGWYLAGEEMGLSNEAILIGLQNSCHPHSCFTITRNFCLEKLSLSLAV